MEHLLTEACPLPHKIAGEPYEYSQIKVAVLIFSVS